MRRSQDIEVKGKMCHLILVINERGEVDYEERYYPFSKIGNMVVIKDGHGKSHVSLSHINNVDMAHCSIDRGAAMGTAREVRHVVWCHSERVKEFRELLLESAKERIQQEIGELSELYSKIQ